MRALRLYIVAKLVDGSIVCNFLLQSNQKTALPTDAERRAFNHQTLFTSKPSTVAGMLDEEISNRVATFASYCFAMKYEMYVSFVNRTSLKLGASKTK